MMKAPKILKACVFALVFTVAIADAEERQNAGAVRAVPVPKREHGYSNFDSKVIRSAKEWETFLKLSVDGEAMGWNNRQAFMEAIRNAKVNFEKEALVLVRHTEGSGSTQITLAPPHIKGSKVVLSIARETAGFGTSDMAYYCFAFAVDKARITELEVAVSGREPKRISLK